MTKIPFRKIIKVICFVIMLLQNGSRTIDRTPEDRKLKDRTPKDRTPKDRKAKRSNAKRSNANKQNDEYNLEK